MQVDVDRDYNKGKGEDVNVLCPSLNRIVIKRALALFGAERGVEEGVEDVNLAFQLWIVLFQLTKAKRYDVVVEEFAII